MMWTTVRRQETRSYKKQEVTIVPVKLEMPIRKLNQELK